MALADLSRVTETLMTLLQQNISAVAEIGVTVTPQQPDKVGASASNTLSLYLYHVTEDGHYKNVQGPGNDVPSVATAPMALNLFYILTVHHTSLETPELEDLQQQNLMGYALKTFHDFPVITDQTAIGGVPILHQDLRNHDNNLQVIMRPVSPQDALVFWSSGSSENQQAARLSAYYEVRVVMLEPEKPKSMPGIVLNLGTFLVQLGAPHLDCSENVVRFTLPATHGSTEHEVTASPARVRLDTGGPPESPNNRLALLGTNLSAGKSRSLFLRSSQWVNLGFRHVEVDPALNPTWNVEFRTDRIVLDVGSTLDIKDDGGTTTLEVLPGAYTALVRVVQDEKVINQQLKQITVSSNEVGFFVTPHILSHGPLAGTVEVQVGAEFDLLDSNLPDDAVELIVDGVPYERVTVPPADGEFTVASVPGVSNTLTINPPFVNLTEIHPLRLLVNGADAPPFWLEP